MKHGLDVAAKILEIVSHQEKKQIHDLDLLRALQSWGVGGRETRDALGRLRARGNVVLSSPAMGTVYKLGKPARWGSAVIVAPVFAAKGA